MNRSICVFALTTSIDEEGPAEDYSWNRLINIFELGYSEFPVISNLNPFPLDLPFSRLLSAISNSRYFEQFFFPPASSTSGVQLYIIFT